MNKNDWLTILIIIVVVVVLFIVFYLNKKEANIALVYHGSDIVLKIDLSIDDKYIVKGDNGDVEIIVSNNKIKVESENSPYHICSKQGYISKTGESIVCLPNRIIIELPNNDDIDTEVK